MMTPKTREYRSFDFELQDELRATGKPVVFNSPTVLFKDGDIEYYEQIDAKAFEGADLSDVVLVANHEGTPAARTRNGTLKLDIRADALYMDADLSKSSVGPAFHSDIKNGVYDRMSFAFTIAEESYDRKTRMRTIKRIDRLFDVSAVTFPAYNNTNISARSFFEAEAEKEKELVEAECEYLKALAKSKT